MAIFHCHLDNFIHCGHNDCEVLGCEALVLNVIGIDYRIERLVRTLYS